MAIPSLQNSLAAPVLQTQLSPYPASGQNTASSEAPNFGPAYQLDLSGKSPNESNGAANGTKTGEIGTAKAAKSTECKTCKSRQYQDGSNEGNVSFKAPGHISPETSGAKVMSHELEHVANAKTEAAQDEDKELVSVNVRTYTGVCPECGKTYVAGGETETVMKTTVNKNKSQDGVGQNVGIAA